MNKKTTARIGIAGMIAALALGATACGTETSTDTKAKSADSSWMKSAEYWASASASNPAQPEPTYTGPRSADGAENWSSSAAESRIKSGTAAQRAANDRLARAEARARAEHTLLLRRTHRG